MSAYSISPSTVFAIYCQWCFGHASCCFASAVRLAVAAVVIHKTELVQLSLLHCGLLEALLLLRRPTSSNDISHNVCRYAIHITMLS
jgi:hypothetical protein